MTTLVLEIKKIQSDDRTVYSTFYLNLKAETTINESYMHDLFKSVYNIVISHIKEISRTRSRLDY